MTEQNTIESSIPDYPRGITFEQVWAALMEDRESMKELRERQKETARIIEDVGKRMGYMDNRFGELAEHLVAPGIMEKFNELGYEFTGCANNYKIKENGDPRAVAEVDILLENGGIVIGVEVKSKPKLKDVDDHIKRMEKIRLHADKKQDKRKYCGAIAGAVMSGNVREYILQNGFFVIEQSGDTMKISVPDGFVPREF
jgi:hypothetical protein